MSAPPAYTGPYPIRDHRTVAQVDGYKARNRERVTFGPLEDALIESAGTLGTVLGKVQSAILYLDCDCPDKAREMLAEALALRGIEA